MSQAQPDPFESIRSDVYQQRQVYLETVEPHRPELEGLRAGGRLNGRDLAVDQVILDPTRPDSS